MGGSCLRQCGALSISSRLANSLDCDNSLVNMSRVDSCIRGQNKRSKTMVQRMSGRDIGDYAGRLNIGCANETHNDTTNRIGR